MTDKEKIEQLQSLLDAYRAENDRLIAKADALKKELDNITKEVISEKNKRIAKNNK